MGIIDKIADPATAPCLIGMSPSSLAILGDETSPQAAIV